MQVHIEKAAPIHNGLFIDRLDKLTLQNDKTTSENYKLKAEIQKKNQDMENESMNAQKIQDLENENSQLKNELEKHTKP